MTEDKLPLSSKTRLAVLISGSGTNLQAIIDDIRGTNIPAEIAVVISNKSDAYGLQRARNAGIKTAVIDHRTFPDRAAFDGKLRQTINANEVDLVVLAGFMRILSDGFVQHFQGRIMNIHPSLLPRYKGLHTHERALADNAQQHGASVHFVTPELDTGPIIIQDAVPVLPDDTPETLQQRVHEVEYRIYPQAIRWFAEGRLTIRDDKVLLDNQVSAEQGLAGASFSDMTGTND